MKIHSITLTNLASIKGSYTIDFSRQPLQDCGLFAITGPTGAGKTTLLDALTLALYGDVARASNADGVMSYGTGECNAEVVFETAKGCFKAKWARRRARGKADGTLQRVSREISAWPSVAGGELITGKALEAKITEVLGLTKEQFLKSVLLAQGDFTAFLKAKEKERADLLEKMTSTEGYRHLSRKAYRKWKAEEVKESILKTQMGATQLLSEDEEAAKQNTIVTAEGARQKLSTDRGVRARELEWINEKGRLDTALGDAQARHGQAIARKDAEVTTIQKWEAHNQAALFEMDISNWQVLQHDIEKWEAALIGLSEEMSTLERNQEILRNAKNSAEAEQENASTIIMLAKPGLLQAIEQQSAIAVVKEQLQKLEKEIEAKGQDLTSAKARETKIQNDLRKGNEELSTLSQWLNARLGDEHLSAVLTDCREKLQRLTVLRGDIKGQQQLTTQHALAKKAADDEVASNTEKFRQSEESLATLQREEAENTLTLSQWHCFIQTGRTRLHMEADIVNRRNKEIAELIFNRDFFIKNHRTLKDGEECPLCGSLEHPFASRDISALENELENLKIEATGLTTNLATNQEQAKKYDQLLTQLVELDVAEEYPEDFLQEPENTMAKIVGKLLRARADFPQRRTGIAKDKTNAADAITVHTKLSQNATFLAENVAAQTAVYEDEEKKFVSFYETTAVSLKELFTEKSEAELIGNLHRRADAFIENHGKQAILIVGLDSLRAQATQTDKSIAGLQIEIDGKNEARGILLEDIADKTEVIAAAHPNSFPSPKAYQTHLETAEVLARGKATKATGEWNANEQKLAVAQSQQETKIIELQQQETDLALLNQNLQVAFRKAGLPDDILLMSNRILSQESQTGIQQLVESIYQQLRDAATKESDCQKEIAQHLQHISTTATKEELEAEIGSFERQQAEISQQIGAMTNDLHRNTVEKLRVAELLEQMQAQHKEALRWQELSSLIGSAEGDKFARFAQSISLERLLSLANAHLSKLSDRYRLCRCVEQGEELKLLVEDRHMANSRRDSKTLSGGESFLVSLGLALGLADMASQNTRIDSLFIDEGFGSLDEASLDDAISSLESLQARGKTIGVISHVEMLKDRIQTQVQVHKQGGGVSHIEVSPALV